MRFYLVSLIILINLCRVSSALADEKKSTLFIEPKVGYSFLGSMSTGGGPGDSVSGIDVGGNLGIVLGKVIEIGGSFNYMPSVSYVPNGSSTANSPNPTMMTVGGRLGLALSFLRIWGGYNFVDTLGNMQSSSTTVSYGGTSLFGGLGVMFLKVLSLNAEAVFTTYTTTNGSAGSVSISGPLTNNITGRYFIVSLSAPIHL